MSATGHSAGRTDKALEEKIAAARKATAEAVSWAGMAAALYAGDFASRVLLHMLKDAACGRVPVRVICVQPPSMPKEALLFADKLRRIYSLDMTSVRFPAGSDGTEETALALKKAGAVRVISSGIEPFEGGAYTSDSGEHAAFRPLAGFSDEDIQGYMVSRRLPVCSLDVEAGGPARTGVAEAKAEDTDDAALREKLKSLGYM